MRLTILDFGLLDIVPSGEQRGFPGYLIQTGDENILVDTGWPERWGRDAAGAIAADGIGERLRPAALTEENLVPGQLAKVAIG